MENTFFIISSDNSIERNIIFNELHLKGYEVTMNEDIPLQYLPIFPLTTLTTLNTINNINTLENCIFENINIDPLSINRPFISISNHILILKMCIVNILNMNFINEYNSKILIEKCKFIDLSTSNSGGIISETSCKNSYLEINESIFQNCSASAHGGTIYLRFPDEIRNIPECNPLSFPLE
jgi:hypothetical protein